MFSLHHGDCLEVLKDLESESVHSVVTDPPYGLKFMGKKWDHSVPSVEVWKECLRVLKPGGHLLCFAGTRTHHRMACNIEDAGFDIRDMIAWLYGSGFPRSMDVSKAIDKEAGAEREKVKTPAKKGIGSANTVGGDSRGESRPWIAKAVEIGFHEHDGPVPVTPEAQQWQGWGTALKPALEPITMARKPFKGTVADNVLAHGTGAINVDGCRVLDGSETGGARPEYVANMANQVYGKAMGGGAWENTSGRWPANLIHDGLQEQWARYFYCPKASKRDRDEGCEDLPKKSSFENTDGCNLEKGKVRAKFTGAPVGNHHPTVKPTDLMAYLCRLVTPPGGVILDPFMGSGSTGKAAVLQGFRFVGIEREAEYLDIARARIQNAIDTKGQESE